ncbi:mitogen-activated protein kinase kinase kinase 2-like [Physella acuta]|uniref:mitogen-activated protein kinase kinase kinase 2-like n=1 Tax=Physella acuta TaxID=109671 RepID=UPI0027DCD002|nr:mitogen-activated protein kinase kinase kinase 2-like [Physella acuta]
MGTLKDHIASHVCLEEEAKHFTSQILQGVRYLHENGILHRDIKSSNILMQSETKVKISDFGLSKILKDQRNIDLSTSVGTVFYMAPEVLKTETVVIYPTKADIWSIGCTVVEMITGMPPYAKDYSCFQVKGRIAANEMPEYELPQSASDALKDFLKRIFKRNPCERPSAEKLLEHIFIVDK